MSYNIRHGEGMDTILDLSRAMQIIKSVNPDFCGLQEIDNNCTRTNNIDQTAYLAEQLNMLLSPGSTSVLSSRLSHLEVMSTIQPKVG